MFKYNYLSKQHLKGLSKYKYSAIDTSPLSKYIMHPTWNTIVNFIPKSVAPNLLTFLGFLCMVTVVGVLYIFDYHLYAAGGRPGYNQLPDWLWTVFGVLVFLAYNLDGIDGKQARRIGVSGPLGELFDHGLDSYIVFLIPFAIMSIFGRDPEFSVPCFRGFLIIISVVMNFYISHVEKYNTGTLYLPWGYDFSMWVSTFIFLLAGAYSPSVYKFYVYGDVTFTIVFETVAHLVGLVTTLPVVIRNIYLSYANRTGRMLPFLEAIRPVWSIAVTTITMVYWAVHSPNNIIELDPRAFIFLYGTLFSNIASRLIISEMTQQRCELVSWQYWVLLAGAGGVLAARAPARAELAVLWGLLAGAVAAHLHYGVCVVRQICDHLKISCFTVPKNKRK